MPIEITARLGSARPMFETLMAKNENRWTWPSHTPSGIAITMAIADRGERDLEVRHGLVSRSG